MPDPLPASDDAPPGEVAKDDAKDAAKDDAADDPAAGGATPPASKGVGRPVLVVAFALIVLAYVGVLQLVGRWFGGAAVTSDDLTPAVERVIKTDGGGAALLLAIGGHAGRGEPITWWAADGKRVDRLVEELFAEADASGYGDELRELRQDLSDRQDRVFLIETMTSPLSPTEPMQIEVDARRFARLRGDRLNEGWQSFRMTEMPGAAAADGNQDKRDLIGIAVRFYEPPEPGATVNLPLLVSRSPSQRVSTMDLDFDVQSPRFDKSIETASVDRAFRVTYEKETDAVSGLATVKLADPPQFTSMMLVGLGKEKQPVPVAATLEVDGVRTRLYGATEIALPAMGNATCRVVFSRRDTVRGGYAGVPLFPRPSDDDAPPER